MGILAKRKTLYKIEWGFFVCFLVVTLGFEPGDLPLETLWQSYFVLLTFQDRVLSIICSGCLQTVIFLISAS
jgi:hypothetical protein